MAVLRTALFLLLANLFTAAMVLIGIVVALIAPPRVTGFVGVWTRVLVVMARTILGIRRRVDGRIPDGAFLIAAKHESAYETVALVTLLNEPVVVLKRQLADVPLFGWLTRRYGVIPVDRTANAAALRLMLRAADGAKKTGRSILIFPEGTRVPHGRAPQLQAGFAGLYARLGLPVVPVALDAGRVWGRDFAKRPGTVRIRFGDPIPPGLPRAEIETQVHAAINALNG